MLDPSRSAPHASYWQTEHYRRTSKTVLRLGYQLAPSLQSRWLPWGIGSWVRCSTRPRPWLLSPHQSRGRGDCSSILIQSRPFRMCWSLRVRGTVPRPLAVSGCPWVNKVARTTWGSRFVYHVRWSPKRSCGSCVLGSCWRWSNPVLCSLAKKPTSASGKRS